jgi:hypothetical protein
MRNSSVGGCSSVLSPLARPYHANGYVAATLQDQTSSSAVAVATLSPEYKEQDMQRLDSMLKELDGISIEDDSDHTDTQQHSHPIQRLPPGLELPVKLPMRTDPFPPPIDTPAESTNSMLPEEPIVRMSVPVYNEMWAKLKTAEREYQALEARIANTEKQAKSRFDSDQIDLQTEIGKLKYQNEVSKAQKFNMAQTLSEKDAHVEQLQLELDSANERLQAALSAATIPAKISQEHDYFKTKLKDARLDNSHGISARTESKDLKIQELSEQVDKLQKALRQAADNQTEDFKDLAELRLNQLNEREKLLRSTKEKYATEHTKVCGLEGEVEDLHHQLSEVSNLQVQLSEKSRICDQLRTSLKKQERQAASYEHALNRATNVSKALQGASHLVIPKEGTKLSTRVMSCVECYAKNLTCDDKPMCRNCSENNEACARWRCSLRHVMERCTRAPCTFPHEADGWLLTPEARPDW